MRLKPTAFVGAFVPPELVAALDRSAREADRTRSAEIRIALREHLERERPITSEEGNP
jgi:predicted transcriptional regulator